MKTALFLALLAGTLLSTSGEGKLKATRAKLHTLREQQSCDTTTHHIWEESVAERRSSSESLGKSPTIPRGQCGSGKFFATLALARPSQGRNTDMARKRKRKAKPIAEYPSKKATILSFFKETKDKDEGNGVSSPVSVPAPSQSSEKEKQTQGHDHDKDYAYAGTPSKSLSSQPTDCDNEEGNGVSSPVSVSAPSQSSEKEKQPQGHDHDKDYAYAGTPSMSLSSQPTDCDCEGCVIDCEGPAPFQPRSAPILCDFKNKGRRFKESWFDDHDWLTLCLKKRKVFCATCRYATSHKLIRLASHRHSEGAFISTGFKNYKKALEKFGTHESSSVHKLAVMKCSNITKPSIQSQLSSQLAQQQEVHRAGLLKQLSAIKYLLRQGLAIRGHRDEDGNLPQLLRTWAEDNKVVSDWIKQGRFMSHDHVNELITLMGHDILKKVLARVKAEDPAWFAVIADEATDVSWNEQLNVSVRYVDHNYSIHEDCLGLFQLHKTDAATITAAIKDILLRTGLPLNLCRGQAYDGAAAMQGHRSGVATRLRQEEPAAVPVHCWAHSLNLCLQDTCRKVTSIRDAMDIVKEIDKLINYSPKRKTLFSTMVATNEQEGGTIKPLCPTRWTCRTAALDSVLNQYQVVMDTMQEIIETTRDDYGLKAGGVLSALEKFGTLFGLRLSQRLFSAAEEISKALQGKDMNVQDAVSSVTVLKSFFQRQRTDGAFESFYNATVNVARELDIGQPTLPRHRRQPKRLDDGSNPYRHNAPKDLYRQIYFEACDLLIGELTERFNQDFLEPLVAMENLILDAANGCDFEDHMDTVRMSVFGKDIDSAKLTRHLSMLPDLIEQALPDVRKVTSIRTVCSVMATGSHRTTFSETHKLLRLYLTVPITSATSERAFSSLKRLLTYLRSSMTEQRLNNCLMLHIHKDLVDTMDLTPIASTFVSFNDGRSRYFGSFN
ncbi:zinc finger, MYM-type [Branchiostoma belcheri]|nr:zinc finger, MYM-type [Branchiostoma belcheri]